MKQSLDAEDNIAYLVDFIAGLSLETAAAFQHVAFAFSLSFVDVRPYLSGKFKGSFYLLQIVLTLVWIARISRFDKKSDCFLIEARPEIHSSNHEQKIWGTGNMVENAF